MTIPYNSSHRSMQDYVKESLIVVDESDVKSI